MTTAARSCPSCATPLPEEALFCLHCGAATPTEPGVPQRTQATGVVEVARVRKALASRYRVERVVGEGGMATVYLAIDLKHHRKVALKVMRPELAATLGSERFLREVEIAARLSHPHILPMHDSGEAEGLLYYVMPYIEGETLRDRIKREGQLPVEEALRLAREIAEALAYAHSQGVVHRDMKPANVLLSAGHALVADFGIARAMGGDAITHTGLAIGTPQYMSPEQAMGDRELDGRTDIYAVGAVLYEMLAGVPPFAGPNSQAILTRSLTEPPRALTAARPAISPAVNSVVIQALAKAPTDRFPDAKAFADALQRALDQARHGSGAVEVQGGVSNGLVWGLFAGASAIAMLLAYSLVRSRGLPSWTLALAVAFLGVGAAVLVATGTRREAARRRARPDRPGEAAHLPQRGDRRRARDDALGAGRDHADAARQPGQRCIDVGDCCRAPRCTSLRKPGRSGRRLLRGRHRRRDAREAGESGQFPGDREEQRGTVPAVHQDAAADRAGAQRRLPALCNDSVGKRCGREGSGPGCPRAHQRQDRRGGLAAELRRRPDGRVPGPDPDRQPPGGCSRRGARYS